MKKIPVPDTKWNLDDIGATAFEDDDLSVLVVTPNQLAHDNHDGKFTIVVGENSFDLHRDEAYVLIDAIRLAAAAAG